ncbi:BrnT family toxin [Lonepinella sp. MS14437]|uniref:BrnT family toxin n=1 Tax=unclassified Lonepinella TaxID=2642006 RepID=UPI0036DBB3E2
MLQIEFDSKKREITLLERGLDFTVANEIFEGKHFTLEDTRHNYGEIRYISIGKLQSTQIVVIVWTYRPNSINPTHRRIISMRKANEREIRKYQQYLR